jgi:hypothetical protein
MNQGTQGYSLTKKTEGQKSRETFTLNLYSITLQAGKFEETTDSPHCHQ